MKLTKATDAASNFWAWMFECPGCECCHYFNDKWNFNGNFESPTVTPSILVRGFRPVTDEEVERIMGGEVITPVPTVCHLYLTDGKIHYLDDCTHKLACQIVEMVDLGD